MSVNPDLFLFSFVSIQIGFRTAVPVGAAQGGTIGIALGVIAYLLYSKTNDHRV